MFQLLPTFQFLLKGKKSQAQRNCWKHLYDINYQIMLSQAANENICLIFHLLVDHLNSWLLSKPQHNRSFAEEKGFQFVRIHSIVGIAIPVCTWLEISVFRFSFQLLWRVREPFGAEMRVCSAWFLRHEFLQLPSCSKGDRDVLGEYIKTVKNSDITVAK